MHTIEMWLLVLTLFFPRIGLIIAWFGGQIPHNDIPFIGDAFLTFFLPRLLMVIYIAGCLGTGSGWFWIHLIGFVVAFLFNLGRTMDVIQKGKNPYDPRSYIPEM